MTNDQLEELQHISYNCLLSLASAEGINASAKNEVFGCIFGRDSFITILKILRALKKAPDDQLLDICKRTLLTHVALQGKEHNIESGEQPGKFIHEYRTDNYDRLTKTSRPWYIYPDKKLRNYDSIDATPLGLIALYRFWEYSHDDAFLLRVLPAVEKGLNWMISYGDMDRDTLLEYEFPKQRQHGGLEVQSWADSIASLLDAKGEFPHYPIAPVEVQGMAWLALRLWGDYYTTTYAEQNSSVFGHKLLQYAKQLKDRFNKVFVMEHPDGIYLAQALDGYKRKIAKVTANPLICLWAAYGEDGNKESIIAEEYVEAVIKRGFASDLFVPHAGIRTMSSEEKTYNPKVDSYHNGSHWPMLNGLIVEGLENFGYMEYASKLSAAMLAPLYHFKTPIELYIEQNGSYAVYRKANGQESCTHQAWSAAAAYDVVTSLLQA